MWQERRQAWSASCSLVGRNKKEKGLFPLGIPYWLLLDPFFTVCNATVFLSCPSSQLFSSLSLDLVCGGVGPQQAMLIKGLVPNRSLLLVAVASPFTAHLCAPAGLLSPTLLPSLAPVPEPVDMGRIFFSFSLAHSPPVHIFDLFSLVSFPPFQCHQGRFRRCSGSADIHRE